MNLEVGKTYLTRNGRKARVICTDRLDPNYTVVALVRKDSFSEEACAYTSNGKFDLNDADGFDLVSEYREPLTRWLVLDSNGSCFGTFSLEETAHDFLGVSGGDYRVVKFIEVV